MDLLPNSIEEFTNNHYWNTFFKNYGGDNNNIFEWYGDFGNLKEFLLNSLGDYGKSKLDNKKIMNIGCGNSNLPIDLFNEGFRDITNIDFSEEIISKMKEQNKSKQDLKWINMDVEKNYEEYVNRKENKQNFDAIIDKGFLDSYLSDQINDNLKLKMKLKKYIDLSMNLLNSNGKYILITLGQDYITKTLALVLYNLNIEIVVIPLLNVKDSKFLPYYIEITKSIKEKNSDKLFFEIKGVELENEKDTSKYCIWSLSKKLKELSAMFWNNKFTNNYISGQIREYNLKIKEYNCEFLITVYDSINPDSNFKQTVGFLVPLGEEYDWIYSTRKGYEEILKQAKSKRLILICRVYNDTEDFINMNEKILINDISKYISSLALENSGKFPILTVAGDKQLNRKCIYKCNSEYCKEILVYDTFEFEKKKRQMIFKSNPRLIQSEVVINGKNSDIEFDYLSGLSNYYIGVLILSSIIFQQDNNNFKKNVLILGLGGGVLASILNKLYFKQNINITAVDIDKNVKEVAANYFGLVENDLNIVIADAFEYINLISKEKEIFDYIIVDINSYKINDPLMCPGIQFFSIDFVNKLCYLLKKKGCLVYNVSCRDSEKRKEIFTELNLKIKKINNQEEDLNLQSLEIGEDEINELWLIKRRTENNIKIVKNFIKNKNLFSNNNEFNSNSNNSAEVWIRRFQNIV